MCLEPRWITLFDTACGLPFDRLRTALRMNPAGGGSCSPVGRFSQALWELMASAAESHCPASLSDCAESRRNEFPR